MSKTEEGKEATRERGSAWLVRSCKISAVAIPELILRFLTGHGVRAGGDDREADANEGEDGGAGHFSCGKAEVVFILEERRERRIEVRERRACSSQI